MRLSLMIAARPTKDYKSGPTRIPPGTWRISCLDIKDSCLSVETRGSPLSGKLTVDANSQIVNGPDIVVVGFLHAGKEVEISVIAEKINES